MASVILCLNTVVIQGIVGEWEKLLKLDNFTLIEDHAAIASQTCADQTSSTAREKLNDLLANLFLSACPKRKKKLA